VACSFSPGTVGNQTGDFLTEGLRQVDLALPIPLHPRQWLVLPNLIPQTVSHPVSRRGSANSLGVTCIIDQSIVDDQL
jgi:hypothetical protein